jgi:arsenate reductase-like glutaredoxin family protein
VDANRVKKGRADALALLRQSDRLVAAKGKKVVAIDLKADRPGDEELLALVLGPTGNLRAPTLRVGKTLLVGFNEEAYRSVLRL